MIEIDPGHEYDLYDLDSRLANRYQRLQFVKRIGEMYPGNEGEPHQGTNCQEVIRALIARVKYLDKQIPCAENDRIVRHLRLALLLFEQRAARRHKRRLRWPPRNPENGPDVPIEDQPTCPKCGHIQCPGNCHKDANV